MTYCAVAATGHVGRALHQSATCDGQHYDSGQYVCLEMPGTVGQCTAFGSFLCQGLVMSVA